MTFPLSQRDPNTNCSLPREEKISPKAIIPKCPSLHSLQMHRGFHGSEKLQAQPQAANNWQFLSGIKVCQTGGAHLYSLNISPSHQKDLKTTHTHTKNPVSKKQMGSLNSEGTGAEGKEGKKGSADARDQIPLHRQHSKPIPSGESCSCHSLCSFQAPLASLPWHTELGFETCPE